MAADSLAQTSDLGDQRVAREINEVFVHRASRVQCCPPNAQVQPLARLLQRSLAGGAEVLINARHNTTVDPSYRAGRISSPSGIDESGRRIADLSIIVAA